MFRWELECVRTAERYSEVTIWMISDTCDGDVENTSRLDASRARRYAITHVMCVLTEGYRFPYSKRALVEWEEWEVVVSPPNSGISLGIKGVF